jgi:hypothetical protein
MACRFAWIALAVGLVACSGDSGDPPAEDTGDASDTSSASNDSNAPEPATTTGGADASGSGDASSADSDAPTSGDDTGASDSTGGEPIELEPGERTMIFSHVEYFCEGTEGSSPHAYVEFAFVDEGALAIVRTQTDCDSIPAFVAGRILGEPVTFEAPATIVREDGSSYTVEAAGPSAVGYDLQKALIFVENADDAALVTNENPAAYIAECETLASTLEREVCLLWQIQLGELDPATCDTFTEVETSFCQPHDGA